VQLSAPRDQLSRISSRLKQIGGLASLELAWEIFAFAHVGVSAAIEEAFSQASQDVMEKLRGRPYSSLSAAQLSAVAEASFRAFYDAERTRSRFDPKKAITMRESLVEELRGSQFRNGGKSVLEATGIPGRDHFRLFFQVATGGVDPRLSSATAPLERLVGRVNQIGGPRNVFAHECAEPSQYGFIAGGGNDWGALASAINALEVAITDLHELFDALEAACAGL
jgi:hypothetical protein